MNKETRKSEGKVEGGLVFDLYRDGPRVADVTVRSERPLKLVDVLRGKSADEGLVLLGLMYRICGVAHRYAALTAWCRALDVEMSYAVRRAQRLLVHLETIREHLWQVLVVWPELLGVKQPKDRDLTLLSTMMNEAERALFGEGYGMAPAARLNVDGERLQGVIDRLQALIERQVCDMPIEQWRGISSPEWLRVWAQTGQTPAAHMIRHLYEENLLDVGAEREGLAHLAPMSGHALNLLFDVPAFYTRARDEFIARPTWRGQCRETNTYTRQTLHELVVAVREDYGNGLLTRLTARLVELVSLERTISTEAAIVMGSACETGAVEEDDGVQDADGGELAEKSGQGAAMIDAARGHLIHWLKVKRGKIADYAIVAPTEWNFHPDGVAVRGLKTLEANDEAHLRRQATLWIHAIDPCVAYELRVH
ncbi:MAG: hypothetical protein GC138_05345 [Gammaproteobacteria bacterium]|nr:hypothetical protein [Gammaproteobacteria bacterium]